MDFFPKLFLYNLNAQKRKNSHKRSTLIYYIVAIYVEESIKAFSDPCTLSKIHKFANHPKKK